VTVSFNVGINKNT